MKWLDFKITQRCNNHCKYCGVKHANPNEKDLLSARIIKKTLEEAMELGFSNFALLGGEPSLRNDFDLILSPFLQDSAKKVNEIMIITNMLEYNPTMIEKLFQSHAQNSILTASIDYLHNNNYKNQNPSSVLEYLKKVIQDSVGKNTFGHNGIHIHSVISRENFDKLESHINYFSNMGLDVSLAVVEPFFLTNTPKHYNEFSKNDFIQIINQLDHLDRDGKLNWANHVLKDYIQDYILNSQLKLHNCTAGRNHVIIEFDGNVYPCLTESYRRGLTFGNIQHTSFSEIYENMRSFHCHSDFHQTCWDHYLWSRLATEDKLEADEI